MRILFLTDKPPWPCDSGGAYGAWTIIRSLTLNGHRLSLLTMDTYKHRASFGIPSGESAGIEKTLTVHTDTRLKFPFLVLNLLFSREPYTIWRFRNSSFRTALQNELTTHYDAIIFEGINTAIYRSGLPGSFSGKTFYRPQNVENIIWSGLADGSSNILKRIYFRLISSRLEKLEKRIINSFDALLSVSREDNEWFVRNGLKKPSAVMLPAIKEAGPLFSDGVIQGSVAFIGSLDWMPNIEGLKWFIENVWHSVISKSPGAQLFVAGKNPGPQSEYLRNVKNVIFLGEVLSSEEFLKNKSILISPLLSGSGIRIKILEALGSGIPVVATTIAASGIEKDCPGLTRTDDPEEFAGTINRLLGNEELRLAESRQASTFVREKYNILNPAKVFNALFNSINISA